MFSCDNDFNQKKAKITGVLTKHCWIEMLEGPQEGVTKKIVKGNPYCNGCWTKEFGDVCAYCSKPIEGKVVKATHAASQFREVTMMFIKVGGLHYSDADFCERFQRVVFMITSAVKTSRIRLFV